MHKYLQELQTQRLPWDTIKFKLRERYSDCSSSAAARSKLTLLKQDGRLLHEYISHFTDLLEHAHNLKPSDPATRLLTTNFIDGIDESNRYIKFKLREKSGPNLAYYFDEAQQLHHKQQVRAIDFKSDTETETNSISHASVEINAIQRQFTDMPQM